MSEADIVDVEFPDWRRSKLERLAGEHAVDVALHSGRGVGGDAPVDRLVVNMLRHEFTSYDANPSQENHRLACEAIAARYHWLKPECDRQINARIEAEAISRELLDWAEETQAYERAERQARAEESRRAIGQIHVGMKVRATVKRYQRVATVLKVGRTRITIGFKIKTGDDRTAVIYASEAQPE